MGAASGRMVLVDRATFLGPPEATPGVSLCGAFYGPCVSPPPHLDGCVLVDPCTRSKLQLILKVSHLKWKVLPTDTQADEELKTRFPEFMELQT
ncbi:hypothetical protein GW17_00048987 [Ensete ventricosum]|nr:hypothetical protein GW17_00048987 [Ensete ventricosum]